MTRLVASVWLVVALAVSALLTFLPPASAGEALAPVVERSPVASAAITTTARETPYDNAPNLAPSTVAGDGRSGAVERRVADDLGPSRASSGGLDAPRALDDDLVPYDPQWASRQLAGQNFPGATGWATTPGGRTLSAHAAERTYLGGPGRAPIDPGMIDDILAQGTRVSHRAANDTIRIGAPNLCGRCFVVVDAQNANHIVTVMVPK